MCLTFKLFQNQENKPTGSVESRSLETDSDNIGIMNVAAGFSIEATDIVLLEKSCSTKFSWLELSNPELLTDWTCFGTYSVDNDTESDRSHGSCLCGGFYDEYQRQMVIYGTGVFDFHNSRYDSS